MLKAWFSEKLIYVCFVNYLNNEVVFSESNVDADVRVLPTTQRQPVNFIHISRYVKIHVKWYRVFKQNWTTFILLLLTIVTSRI